MKLPRLVALDLDDTLLSDNLEISDFTVAVIDFLAEVKGVHFALSSGRSYESLKPYIERLGFQKRSFFCICENGTKIIKTDTAALVEEYGLEFSVALEAYKTGLENGFTCQVYRDDYIIASAENPFGSSFSAAMTFFSAPSDCTFFSLQAVKPNVSIIHNNTENNRFKILFFIA